MRFAFIAKHRHIWPVSWLCEVRLAALIEEDVRRYPRSQISDIHARVGAEIPRTQIKRSIAELVRSGRLLSEGIRRGTRYSTP